MPEEGEAAHERHRSEQDEAGSGSDRPCHARRFDASPRCGRHSRGGRDRAGPRIEAILDASGSMKAKDASGQTRLDAAKQAVTRLIDEVPDRASMGVRVYGASYAGQEPGPGCRDTQLLSPVAPMDAAAKRAAQAQIRSIEAVGMTPIGHALSTAAKDLGGSGPRRIILVSDGADTCGPPTACTVAQGLSGAGIDLVVDTVGFRVDDGAWQELKCISQVTKGSYTDAADADELAAGMGDSVERAFTPYQVSGERVHGADSCEKAPLLEPGHYQDAMAYQQQRWYKVRLRPGERLRFSGASFPAPVMTWA
ncbi:VWA domain-containing protein [Streptomyces flaveus]|uniref:VWA domain-containing protein n=1 Tax=Streptomyces flaveus TaxID=66370 RepID=UPI0033199E8A